MTQRKRIMVDMSATLLHHGHIRILKAAAELGEVVVALAESDEIRIWKGYDPELGFEERKEILEAIRYVDEVVPAPWLITDAFLDRHRIDLLVHGDDNSNAVRPERMVVLPRTPGISSSLLRKRAVRSQRSLTRPLVWARHKARAVADFWKTIFGVVPHLLGNPFTSESDRSDLVHVMRTFRAIASKTELVWWIDYGTLLGAWRWGKILPWDHDVDISYLGGQWPVLEAMTAELAEHGMRLDVEGYGIHYRNIKVDLEPWVERDGILIRPNHMALQGALLRIDQKHDRFPVEWVNPLQQIYLEDAYYNCPNQTERLLRHRYYNIDIIMPHRIRAWLYPRLYRYYREFSRHQPRLREVSDAFPWQITEDPNTLKKFGD